MPDTRRPVTRSRFILGLLLAAPLLAMAVARSEGVTVFGGLLLLLLLATAWIQRRSTSANRRSRGGWLRESATMVAIVATSLAAGFLLLEIYLQVDTRRAEGDGAPTGARAETLTLPEAWQRRRVEVPGASSAWYWHGILHVFDERKFRRTEPIPPKRDDRFRVVVLGDSLTYGVGVESADTYPAVLERELGQTHRIEVLNLGVRGSQSEDIRRRLQELYDALAPDLVVYGICLNDFLAGDESQNDVKGYMFPLPTKVKRFFIEHTLSGRFLSDRYDQTLMRLGLRADFYAEILRDFERFRRRFTADVTAMNELVLERSGSPMLAMVLHQFPRLNSAGHRLMQAAEECLAGGGAEYVPTEAYVRENDGKAFRVSRWEGHPSVLGHEIFAGMLAPAIRARIPDAYRCPER
jgi:lysophospholipase L1-like esterase